MVADQGARANQSRVEDGNLFWRQFLTDELREASRPVFVFEETTVPGGSLWSGAYRWIEALNEAGMEPGDRIVLSVNPGPAFLQVLLASFWDDYSVVLVSPDAGDCNELVQRFDARLSIGTGDQFSHSLGPNDQGPGGSLDLRPHRGRLERTPSVRIFARRSRQHSRFQGFTTDGFLTQYDYLKKSTSEFSSHLSAASWYRPSGFFFGVLYPLVARKFVVKLRGPAVPPQKLDGTLLGDRSTLCHTHVQTLNDPTVTTIRQYAERVVLSVDPWRLGSEGLDRLRSRFSRGAVRIFPEVRDAVGGCVFETNTPGEYQPLGSTVRVSSDGEYELYSRAVSSMEFDPIDASITDRSVPRWLNCGLDQSGCSLRRT